MAQFNVTELDFDKIKDSLKSYLRANPTYTDWDFDGSGLNVIMDILAYNTHYNAMLAHFALNETFLDSAQIRGNVVSHAKLLGYVPRSVSAPTTKLNLTITPVTGNASADITVPRGTRFTTSYNGTQYSFVVVADTSAYRTVDGLFEFRDNTTSDSAARTANPIYAKEGKLKRMLYRVNESITNQRYEIPDADVDTTTLRVRIKENEYSNKYTTYTEFVTLSGVSATTPVYFLQENSTGKYEIFFGDGYVGNKPITNNIVEIEYLYTNGAVANGANTFEIQDIPTGAETNVTIETVDAAYGGSARESIESIRYNAPISYVSQNRAVTTDDYKAIISRDFGAIDSIAVWGGEDQVIPDFGKAFICVKPTGKDLLSDEEKNRIVNTILAGKNVASIQPVIVDPEYTYIDLDVAFKYNPNLTNLSKTELQTVVRNVIQTYAQQNLQKFDGVFRHSQLLRLIDTSNDSILSSSMRVFMTKYVTPVQGLTYYELNYSSPIYQTKSTESVMQTDEFKIGGITHYLKDEPQLNSTDRTIYLWMKTATETRRVRSVGTIATVTGKVILEYFNPDTTTPVAITVLPNSNDLAPKRNQLLDILMTNVAIIGEIDSIAVGGTAGAINYTTQSRHRGT